MLLWLLKLSEMSRYGFQGFTESVSLIIFAFVLHSVWFVQDSRHLFLLLSNTEHVLAKL